MIRVKIQEIKGDQNPYEVVYRRFDTTKPITLSTGQVIQNDVLKGLSYLYNDIGIATRPQAGDQAYIIPINATEYLALCVDWEDKPDRIANELCLGNFKTENFMRINDDTILIEEAGTDTLYVDINSVTLKSAVKHLVETTLLEMVSSTTTKIESTGGKTSVEASTDVDLIAGALVNLGGLGGVGVARIGDVVDLNPISPTYTKIISGSSKVLSL